MIHITWCQKWNKASGQCKTQSQFAWLFLSFMIHITKCVYCTYSNEIAFCVSYCIVIWTGMTSYWYEQLQVLPSICDIKRIEFNILLLTYKCLHGTAPSYLREMLIEYVPSWTLRATSNNLLCEPRTNIKSYGDRSFSACAPKLWNQHPNNIRAAGSVAIFKWQLKTHLFKDVFIK